MVAGRGTVSERVVEAMAAMTGRDALDLPPLYDAIDPEALNAIGGASSDAIISFSYAGRYVTVGHDGVVSVDEQSASFSNNETVASDD